MMCSCGIYLNKNCYIVSVTTVTVQLTNTCYITSCTQKQTKHAVTIRLVHTSDKVNIQVVNTTFDQHTHNIEQYMYWYLGGKNTSDKCMISPFYTKSYTEIIEFVNQNNMFAICCSIKKH